MTTRLDPFASAPMPDELTAAIAIAIWRECHEPEPEPTREFALYPGELHGMTPTLPNHLGRPMLRRARRRHQAGGELILAE